MRKMISILMISLMSLTACTVSEERAPDQDNIVETPQEKPAETPTKTPSDNDGIDMEVVAAFKESIEDADDPLEIRESMELIMKTESDKTSDAVLSAYLEYLNEYKNNDIEPIFDEIQKLQPYFEEGTQNLFEESITEESLKNLYNRFTQMGYKFVQIEGSVEPIVDYAIVKDYSSFISEEMIAYGEFKSLESREMWAADGGIVIPLVELGERIAKAEAFIKAYPDSELKPHVLEYLGFYLSGFLGGLDNTPSVVGEKYNPDFISAYEAFLASHPNTETAKVLKTYYEELKQTDFEAPYLENDPDSLHAFREEISSIVDTIINGL